MTRAVTIDALGTLVRMEPPGARLRAELERLTGVDVGEERAAAAFAAEIAYYLEHHVEGRDPAALDQLRDRCARVMRDALGLEDVGLPLVREAMLGSLRFRAFPDAAPALEELRAHGLIVVAASNWDSSLPEVLERTGLAVLLDGVVSSAVAGATKPAPNVFRAALELAGAEPSEAVHVGDSPDKDLDGALAIGMRAILLDRAGGMRSEERVPVIRTLAELPSLVLAG